MKTTSVLLAGLLLATVLVAAAPAAEARQFCTYGSGDPCDEYLVCVWDHVNGGWLCEGYVDPCWFRCW